MAVCCAAATNPTGYPTSRAPTGFPTTRYPAGYRGRSYLRKRNAVRQPAGFLKWGGTHEGQPADFLIFLFFSEGRHGRRAGAATAPARGTTQRVQCEIYATANRGEDDRWPNRGQAGPSGVRAGGRVGLAAASAALKRKPKATAAAPVLVLAVAVRPQPAFPYFLIFWGTISSLLFLSAFFLNTRALCIL